MPYDAAPLIDRLCEAFPDCFNQAAPKPLKVGIGLEVLDLAGTHPALTEVTRTQLRRALKIYTRRFIYRKALAAGGARYGLDGQPAGEVTPDQQTFAKPPRQKPASPATGDSASPTEPAALPPIDRAALLKEIMSMAIPGKLEVTIKVNQLPEAKPASPQTMLFAIQADGKTVVVEVKNKVWNNLKAANEKYPQWVAAITGKMGAGVQGGFRLDSPAVQVFEKKPKPETTTSAETTTATTPVVVPAPVPAAAAVQPPPADAAVQPPPADAAVQPPPIIDRPKLSLKGRTKST